MDDALRTPRPTPRRPCRAGHGALAVLLAVLGACRAPEPEASRTAPEAPSAPVLIGVLGQIEAYADSLDARLRPVALLTAREQAALQAFSNEAQLLRARRLGVVPPGDSAGAARLRRAGRLVALEASTPLWTVRPLEHSAPLVTPDARALLTMVGQRFQARLAALKLPPLRLEVTSALRTAATQADLRRSNRNATAGTSTHEFGTTFDVAYSSFRAPEVPGLAVALPEAPWLTPVLHRYERALVETVAARRSRELQALLGRVLRELQAEGAVMVTLEQQQPVYHMTVARRF